MQTQEMQNQLRVMVNEWGFSGVLEILGALAEEKQNIQPDDRKEYKKRYGKIKSRLWLFANKKLLHGV